MKRILQILFLSTVFIASCEQEEFPGSGLESLRDFALNPVPNSKIALNSIAKTDNIVFSWEVARSGFDSPVLYTWMLDEEGGDFSSPVLSFPSDNGGTTNSFTRTNDEWETILTGLGVAAEGEFKGQWTVRATNEDVTKTAESHPIAIMRYSEAIMSFVLTGPVNGSTIFLKESKADSVIEITWEATLSGLGAPVTYELLFDEQGGDFSDPELSIAADSSGLKNKVTYTHEEWETALAGIGIEAQSLADFQWTVKATAADAIQFADEAFDIKLVRWGTEVRLRIPSLPTFTPPGRNIYVAGSFSFLGIGYGDWEAPGSNDLLRLIKDTDDSYYLDINVPKGHTFEYKFAAATSSSPSYDFEEQKFNQANDGCEGIPNRSFTFDGTNNLANHTVDSWKKFCPYNVADVTFVMDYDTIPAGYNVYMAGEFDKLGLAATQWNEPGTNQDLKLTFDATDSTYKKTFSVSEGFSDITIGYKYFVVPDGSSSWGHGEQKFKSDSSGCEGRDNRSFTFNGSAATVPATVISWEGFCPL